MYYTPPVIHCVDDYGKTLCGQNISGGRQGQYIQWPIHVFTSEIHLGKTAMAWRCSFCITKAEGAAA